MLPTEARGHHTVWITPADGGRAVPVRYAVSGDQLVCFGDDGLAGIAAGTRVRATLHEIACGPPIATFYGTLRELEVKDVPLSLVADIAGNAALPRRDGVDPLERIRDQRRIVAFEP